MDKVDEVEFVGETTGVGRTFAYTVSVFIQIVWLVIITLLLISDNHRQYKVWWDIFSFVGDQHEEQGAERDLEPWERTIHTKLKLLPCLLLPLLIIVPPIFRRQKYRAITTIVICSVGLLLQSLHLVSSLLWVFQAENGSLEILIPELLLREAIAAVLTASLGIVLHTTCRAWKEGKMTNIAVDINQVGQRLCPVSKFIIFEHQKCTLYSATSTEPMCAW